MSTIANPNVVCCDVDDTIVFWGQSHPEHVEADYVDINTPWGTTETLIRNAYIVDRIRQHHTQGHYIIVWSGAGEDWAEAVLTSLGIRQLVNLVITKPKWMYDDLPPHAWTHLLSPTPWDKANEML